MTEAVFPPALKPGDTIGVIAPSSQIDKMLLAPAEEILRQRGYAVVYHPHTDKKHGQFAGTATEKIGSLHDFFSDSNIHAIVGMVGGNGALHLLDKIDYNLIRSNPKIFMGFSDTTALCNALYTKSGLVTFHGPTISRFHKIKSRWVEQTFALLSGSSKTISLEDGYFIQGSCIEGTLIGGNLSVFQALIGTPYLPSPDGSILFIEDIADHISRYDRMIGHLRLSGYLSRLSGLIVGQFLNTQDNPERPFGFTLEDIIREHTAGLNIPVLMNAPFGHGDNLPAFPIGARVTLSGSTLTILDLPT